MPGRENNGDGGGGEGNDDHNNDDDHAGGDGDYDEDVLPANEVFHQEAGETSPSSWLRERKCKFQVFEIIELTRGQYPFPHCHQCS